MEETNQQYLQLILGENNKEFVEFYDFKTKENIEYLPNLNYINIFVGANNSRKSRFTRKILLKDQFLVFSKDLTQRPNKMVDALTQLLEYISKTSIGFQLIIQNSADFTRRDIEDSNTPHEIIELLKKWGDGQININHEFFKNFLNFYRDYIVGKNDNENNFKETIAQLDILLHFIIQYKTVLKNNERLFPRALRFNNFARLNDEIITFFERIYEQIKYNENLSMKRFMPPKIYIPSLRIASSFMTNEQQKIKDDILKSTILTNYRLPIDNKKIEVFTGYGLYKTIKTVRNNRRIIRKNFEEFELFLSKNFFDEKTIDIIAVEDDNESKQQIQIFIDGEDDRYLYDLGDGIQSLIILLYPIFMAEEGTWVFIEEPELNMHPGLQNIFLNTLITNEFIRKKNLRIFFSTHSNHLLNIFNKYPKDLSIFSFRKDNENKTIIKSEYKNNTDLLDLLGVFNSSVTMSNCSIWVEGISDRKYISAFLKAYSKSLETVEFKEDIEYSFYEYAGSNLSHYFFSEEDSVNEELDKKIKSLALSNRIFLLSDEDESEIKKSRHKKLKELENKFFKFETTGAREIENVLTSDIIYKLLIDVLKIKQTYISKLRIEDSYYEQKRLGKYLHDKLKTRKVKLPFFKAKSGTISDYYKIKFSNYVFENVVNGNLTWEMISKNKHAKYLTEKIYNFIKSSNNL
ncbi:MAG: AAA family ATPase [Bacteroidetes bacterium]|nr:AAA family ATPase [Bacteroidota bacterium]